MKTDYHMHLEYGTYNLSYVQGFFDHAQKRGLSEIGISEHSHTFIEFKDLYYDELLLDNSPLGRYQQQWLAKNKFRYSLNEYLNFMNMLKEKGYPVKTGIEVCNFHNQAKVQDILARYNFDYIIGSVHYLNGQGYDFSEMKYVWDTYPLYDIYACYVKEILNLCSAKLYDILGHPFNIRLFKNFPDFDVQPLLEQVAAALRQANMAIDVNTGTLYRYPVAEISPYPAFLDTARRYQLPIILSSDAHHPEDCGKYIDKAAEYAQAHGYHEVLTFTNRRAFAQEL